jgi:anti-sigma factor RsiW
MVHQPFDNWLLDQDSLSSEQRREMEAHLLTCPECQQLRANWLAVAGLVKSLPQAAPAPGFSRRWQKLQLERSTRQQPRQVRMFFLALLAGSLASLALLSLFFAISRVTLSQVLVAGTRFLTSLYSVWVQAQSFFSSQLSGPTATALWVLISSGICILVIVWIVAVNRITTQGTPDHETLP